ncbi:PaaI family thioesterase [Trichloromonas sp.]|uniref:PaaI family thioesterase n=1 Tax=Trichloromonas sp. TaxID=3069249 RepID=UPI003D8168D2
MAAGIPLLNTLGIRLVESGECHAVMAVVVDARHLNYLGGAHGGLLATLADTVCFFPASLLPSGLKVATSNLNLNYIRGGQVGDRLLARSQILHLGRRTVSLSVTIHDSCNRLMVHGTATLVVLA